MGMIMSARPKSNLSCKLAFEAMALIHLFFFSWVTALVTGKAMPNIPSNTSSTTPAPADNLTEVDPHINVGNYVFLGSLESQYNVQYGVYGNVFAVNCTTLFIQDFSSLGTGIRVNWIAGNTDEISKHTSKFKIPDETGSIERIIRPYYNESFYLKCPAGQTLLYVKWIAFLCQSFNLNLGSVDLSSSNIPCNLDSSY